jgi:shikimate dehydrogenase
MNHKFVIAGVMGWPVAYSRSPIIHNYWINKYRLHGAYGLFAVSPGSLKDAFLGIKTLGLAGCNITIPHKVEAMQYMDWIDPVAQKMGAINTVVRQADGELHGFNTDGFGYIQSLKEANPNWQANAGPIVVLGAGGAARGIILSLILEGATEIRLLNRTLINAQALANELGSNLIQAIDWAERNDALSGASLLINTTNQGMHGQAALDIQLEQLPMSALVSDAIYIPLETTLLTQARLRGHTTVNGLGMLLNQARPGFEHWFGVAPEIDSILINQVTASI